MPRDARCAHCHPPDRRDMVSEMNEYGRRVWVHTDERDVYRLGVRRRMLANAEADEIALTARITELRKMIEEYEAE